MKLPLRPSARPMAWLLMGYLACALLLAQTLGLMHGVTHEAGKEPHVTAASADHGHGPEAVHAGGWVKSLFSSHDGAADCRLFDQASQDGALPAFAQAILPALPPSVAVAIFQSAALARWAALFDARGPPLTP